MLTTYRDQLESPVGTLYLGGGPSGLTQLLFQPLTPEPGGKNGAKREPTPDEIAAGKKVVQETVRQLKAYFAGKRQDFDLTLAPSGTVFQRQTWQALQKIPWGTTISYGELARRLGRPKAVRAVGAANGRNPISIIIPCHRVVGSDGSLTGYGGGLAVKRQLLELEAKG
jgi:methylated-DNA-[protein]-cysteine S-methyltransferase